MIFTDFKNRIVLITDASSGIGKNTAIEFTKKSSNIVLVSKTKEKLEQTADELKQFNTTVLVCQCDVSKKDQVKEISKTVSEKFNSIDILVNNACGVFQLKYLIKYINSLMMSNS